MSRYVTDLVRAARLPNEWRDRPQLKLVMSALADDCNDNGAGAWPSESTIAAESEISLKTARKRLAFLQHNGLIFEQATPTPRRPRTYSIDLVLLKVLIADDALAKIEKRRKENDEKTRGSGRQIPSTGLYIGDSGKQISGTGLYHSTDDPSGSSGKDPVVDPAAASPPRAPLPFTPKPNPLQAANSRHERKRR